MRVLAFVAFVCLIVAPSLAQPVILRPYDALFDDPRLIAIVDAQSQRDAGPINRAMQDGEATVRARAALAAGSVQSPTSLEPLIALLDDESAAVRADAAFALGQLRDSTAALPLLHVLRQERDARAVFHLYQAIGETAGWRILPDFLAHEPDRGATWQHALAIARIGMRGVAREAVARHLVALLRHPDAEARRHAAYYFWRVNDADSWQELLPNVRATLQSLDRDDPAVGYLAMALSVHEDSRDISYFRRLVDRSEDWRTRARAARALGRFSASTDAFEILRNATRDSVHHVAEAAAQSLSNLPHLTTSHVEPLQRLLRAEGSTSTLRASIAQALVHAGSYEDALALSEIEEMRMDIAPVLAVISDSEARRRLFAIARGTDNRVAAAGLSGLVSRWLTDRDDEALHEAYYLAFSEAVESLNSARIFATAPILSDPIIIEMGSASLISRTFDRLDYPRDVSAGIALVQAARQIDHDEARAVVERAARHDHHAVRAASGATDGPEAPNLRQPDWDRLQAIGPRPRLRFGTDRGSFDVELFGDLAPVTVQTIVTLAEEGRYDGVPFHRVLPDFVAQGGDFSSRDGYGGPGFEIPSEFTPLRYATGTMGMASSGKDTEGSQFFFTHSMQPHLDGRYTAFGVVLEGQHIVDSIRRDDRIIAITRIDD